MKKKILLFGMLIGSIATFAQQVTFGGAAGVAHYNLRGDAVKNVQQLLDFSNGIISTQPLTGFFAGGFVNIPVAENFSIEPGLNYSSKGYQITGSYTVKDISILSAKATATLKSNYMDIPVLLKANIQGWQLFAGPQVSYLLNASLKTRASLLGIALFNNELDLTQQLNRWDAGLIGGAGYQFNNGMRITATYERGLTSVDANSNTQTFNQGIKIGLGYRF